MKRLLRKEGGVRLHGSSWNLIVCEERAGRFIQNVEQNGCMKVQRIISADGSSGSLREGHSHQGRRCPCDK